MKCYARSVVHQEWPEMARGKGLGINLWAAPLFRTQKGMVPVTPTKQAAYAKWLDLTSEREQARNVRTVGEDGVIPC